MKCSVFIATSLDGYIARPGGEIDWLSAGSTAPDPNEDFGYHAFMDTVDALVMGRATFEKVLGFDVWPYGAKPVFVLSSRENIIPQHLSATVERISLNPVDIVSELSKRGIQHAYVDGGKTIQAFLSAGLIQRLVISRIPVLIGRGLPLFGELRGDVNLIHVSTRSFANGLVQSVYEVPAN